MIGDDDELRRRIADAHGDDAPPPFAAMAARARPRWRRRLSLALAPVALAIAAALVLLLGHPPAPPRSLHVDARGPLDFLLQTPGGELLHDTPHFDREGAIP
jgi:hypothetical protein